MLGFAVRIMVDPEMPEASWPFRVTKFTDEEKDGRKFDGFEIRMAAPDIRDVFPNEGMSSKLTYEAYLVDSHRVVAIVPAIGHADMKDEEAYEAAKQRSKTATPCNAAASKRNEQTNRILTSKPHEGRLTKRILFCFPDEFPICNDIYRGSSGRNSLEMNKVIYTTHFTFVSSNKTANIPLIRTIVSWRVTIATEVDRLTKLEEDDRDSIVDMISQSFAAMQTG